MRDTSTVELLSTRYREEVYAVPEREGYWGGGGEEYGWHDALVSRLSALRNYVQVCLAHLPAVIKNHDGPCLVSLWNDSVTMSRLVPRAEE